MRTVADVKRLMYLVKGPEATPATRVSLEEARLARYRTCRSGCLRIPRFSALT